MAKAKTKKSTVKSNVKEGTWINGGPIGVPESPEDFYNPMCSNCNFIAKQTSLYCPNCKAKMNVKG